MTLLRFFKLCRLVQFGSFWFNLVQTHFFWIYTLLYREIIDANQLSFLLWNEEPYPFNVRFQNWYCPRQVLNRSAKIWGGFRLNNLYLKTPTGLGASSAHVLSYVKKLNEQCNKIKRGDRCLPRNNYICIAMYK